MMSDRFWVAQPKQHETRRKVRWKQTYFPGFAFRKLAKVHTQANTLEHLESRYDQVLTDLDELLSRIDSTILKNKPAVVSEPTTAPASDQTSTPAL
jgi:hypothetical protein